MIFDMLDGKLARLTNSTGQFGIEYDSLSDVVSFGVAPGRAYLFLCLEWARDVWCGSDVCLCRHGSGAAGPVQCHGGPSDGKYFTGLAIPAAAGVIASLVIFDHYTSAMGAEVKPLLFW